MEYTKPYIWFLAISVFSTALANPKKKSGCPLEIDIRPCLCFNSPYTVLLCKYVDDSEVIRNVFKNSTKYNYREVHIEYSTLHYLPSEVFDAVEVEELHLKNVTLSQLFDTPPAGLHRLHTLHIENTVLLRGVMWQLLEPLKNLKVLNIYFNAIRTLGKEFVKYTTKELRQLTLYKTSTKIIKPGVFKEFVNLDKLEIDGSEISQLSRDLFPVPFNVRYLYFNGNKLTEIPDDLFTAMPRLHSVGLRNNQLTVIPQSAFEGSFDNIQYFMLTGNPLICDCRLHWLIQNKPPALMGSCALPTILAGRELKDINEDYFNC